MTYWQLWSIVCGVMGEGRGGVIGNHTRSEAQKLHEKGCFSRRLWPFPERLLNPSDLKMFASQVANQQERSFQ